MFDNSLLDPSNPELVAAEAAAGDELSRGVASLPDRHAQAVNPELKATVRGVTL
jgi:hypothetical protein